MASSALAEPSHEGQGLRAHLGLMGFGNAVLVGSLQRSDILHDGIEEGMAAAPPHVL